MSDNKNNIAFVIHGFSMGGAEKFLISLVNNFCDLGYKPVVVSLSSDNLLLHELDARAIFKSFTKKHKFDFSTIRATRSFFIEMGVKKIFCINTYSFFISKLAFLFNPNIQFYLSLHSTIPISKEAFFKNLLFYRFLNPSDSVIYLCNNQRQYLKKKYFLPTALEYIINNGIDKEYFNPAAVDEIDYTNLKAEYGIPLDSKVMVKVARINPEKGHMDAIEALNILHNHFKKQVHLIFVGGGTADYISTLRKKAFHYHLNNYIHFTNSQPDVRKFYQISDVFTLTSTSETFSIAALEAMAFGLPCALTDIGGANEMMIEGVTGMLSKPNNPVSIALTWNLLLDRNLKGNVIRQYFIDNFSSENMFQSYRRLLFENSITSIN